MKLGNQKSEISLFTFKTFLSGVKNNVKFELFNIEFIVKFNSI